MQADVEKLRAELDKALKQARHSLANLGDAEAALHRIERRLASFGAAGLDAPAAAEPRIGSSD